MPLLALTLAFGALTVSAEMQNTVPEVGEEISGFRVDAVEDYDLLDAKVVYLTHEKTDGPVIWIANDDTERSFFIGFRTHYDNDSGVPHVFEHAALSGSEAYPDPQLFFGLMSNTCETYLNATTYTFQTVFPCASISDKQLLKFADVYLSGVFEPLVLTDAHAMEREAYRYGLTDADADLTLTGTVYSEMLGNYYSAEESYEVTRQLYPGSWYATVTGGQPGVIETMTQQDLIDFHDTYYQPSNALSVLYGDLKLEDFLELMAGYYDRYDKVEVSTEDPGYTPFTGYSEVSVDVCASADAAAETDLYYCMPLRDISEDDYILVLNFLNVALNNQASALHELMMERFPQSTFSVGIDTSGAETMLKFLLSDAPEDANEDFVSAVKEGVQAVLDEGLNYSLMEAALKSVKRNSATVREESNIGVDVSTDLMTTYTLRGSCSLYFRDEERVLDCEDWLTSGTLETLIKEQIADPDDSRLVVINKVPGLQEQKEQEAAQKLVDKKTSMTEEEINEVIAATLEYEEWTDKLSETSMIDEVNVLTVDEFPEETREAEAAVTYRNGVRYISSEVEDSDLAELTLYFDTSMIPASELQRYAAAINLFGSVDTESHSKDELSTLYTEYGVSFEITCVSEGSNSDDFRPVLAAKISCLNEDIENAVAFVNEILTETKYDDYSTDRYLFTSVVSGGKFLYGQYYPHYLIRDVACAAASTEGLYKYNVNSIPFFIYADDVSKMDDESTAVEAEAWKSALETIVNRNHLAVTIVGSAEGIAQGIAAVEAQSSDWAFTPHTGVDYEEELEALPKRIGITIPGSANYNMKYLSTEDDAYVYTPDLNILSSLCFDQILVPVMRNKNGVYGPSSAIDKDEAYILAYRDPDITTTFDEVIPSLADSIKEMNITDSMLSNLIVSAYTTLAMPVGPITAAENAVMDVLNNTNSQSDKLEAMTAYKEVTAEQLKEAAEIFDTLSADGVVVTAGPQSTFTGNEDKYDEIITWFVE